MSKNQYNANSLRKLKGLAPVRETPGMYVGDTNVNGLHQLIWEAVDNSIDEALAGHCNSITVRLTKDGYAEVEDDGRGIPTDMNKEEGVSGVELVLTELHAGGKFQGGDKENVYKVSGGLHGVGISCTNALSEHLVVTVKQKGKVYRMEFRKGLKETKLKKIDNSTQTGTSIKFKPDPEVFEVLEFNADRIKSRLRQLSYLNKGIKLVFEDERGENPTKKEYYSKDGLKDYLEALVGKKSTLMETQIFEMLEDNISVQIAVNYLKDVYSERIESFANNIDTNDGGTHVQGFTRALGFIFSKYAEDLYPKKKTYPTGEDFREGLIAVVNVKLPNPKFLSQTKDKLTNTEVSKVAGNVLKNYLVPYLDQNPSIVKQLVEKSFRSMDAREAARKARENIRKKKGNVIINADKFMDCRAKDPKDRELFIVEGNSAGGTAQDGRDKETQAVMFLRGKPLNTHEVKLSKLYSNEEFNQLVAILGCGINDTFSHKDLKYHKIIIMADADVDGSHISCLLLTFFFKYFKDLIFNGNIFIAVPPLYKIKVRNEYKYIKDDDELELFKKNHNGKLPPISRFKGLGEMNEEELSESTMDAENRTLIQITIEDAENAAEVVDQLMGSKQAAARKTLIDEKGYLAEIDV